MEFVILTFEAPLMSFGGVTVDAVGVIRRFPALSMVCGLIGNALGWHHREFERLQTLQAHLEIASRLDVPGTRILDYQTVDLGQDHLLDDRSWTTRGTLEKRAGASSRQTHIRSRDFWADAVVTTAVGLAPDASVSLADIQRALAEPARPLFIGRKPCLPATPIFRHSIVAADIVDALRQTSLHRRARATEVVAQVPATRDDPEATPISDMRDWANQIHTGQRWVRETVVDYGGDQ